MHSSLNAKAQRREGTQRKVIEHSLTRWMVSRAKRSQMSPFLCASAPLRLCASAPLRRNLNRIVTAETVS
jgi:hypothetical protein